jgi:hypothetical protein
VNIAMDLDLSMNLALVIVLDFATTWNYVLVVMAMGFIRKD